MKLWFDTDPGVDDALAMALIAARPEFEWIGLSTVFGNASVAQTTANALRLLQHLGRADVPVHAGAAAPLVGSARYAAAVHGGDGLGGCADSLPAARRVKTAMGGRLFVPLDRFRAARGFGLVQAIVVAQLHHRIAIAAVRAREQRRDIVRSLVRHMMLRRAACDAKKRQQGN